MIEKTYSPADIEQKFYKKWEAAGAFSSDNSSQADINAQPYTIMMPPPNVTGALHLGHALNNTLQDVLIRYHRMRGYKVLWQPGMDHAGIATQMVVERELAKEGKTRHGLGRDAFTDEIWKWKEAYGGKIMEQLKRLGTSPDWSRTRFTLDQENCDAVRKVFLTLYREGLIYRDQRLVNWDPKFQTAVSDLEVDNVEKNGCLWRIRYPLVEDEQQSITIATTRPETLLGDMAIAVHPDDVRYQHLIGKFVKIPLVGREIPIIADTYSDPEKGSGAVKITPAHDFNDFEVGRRHNLDAITILDETAHINTNAPKAYQGLDRFDARKKILEDLKAQGFYEGEEPIKHMVPQGERSGEVVEPRLTYQWFVDAQKLAKPAIEAVEKGETRFVPAHWSSTYFHWLKNIQPWCISRQIWWGHRIPVWYGPDGHHFGAESEQEAQNLARTHYGKDVSLTQETDVLDTWFSSALWPFATLGWPKNTPELEKHYPGDTLITGDDIIFFWVARMMMMGLKFKGEVPFKTVYMNALVRDEKGQKMSKTRGNIIDPLALVDEYGADALRMTLTALSVPGRSINFSNSQIEGYRNFTTKLWNAYRYLEGNGCKLNPEFNPESCKTPVNRWIISELYKTGLKMAQALKDYRFDEAASGIYQFVKGTFCDWYLEFTKPLLGEKTASQERETSQETRDTIGWVFGQILHLLNPIAPFISEALWEALDPDDSLLIQAAWPVYAQENFVFQEDQALSREMGQLIELISALRALRQDLNLPAGVYFPFTVESNEEVYKTLRSYQDIIRRLARVELKAEHELKDRPTLAEVIGSQTYMICLDQDFDLQEEVKRREGILKDLQKEIMVLEKKLGNAEFTDKAPAHIVKKNELRLEEAVLQKNKHENVLERLQVAL